MSMDFPGIVFINYQNKLPPLVRGPKGPPKLEVGGRRPPYLLVYQIFKSTKSIFIRFWGRRIIDPPNREGYPHKKTEPGPLLPSPSLPSVTFFTSVKSKMAAKIKNKNKKNTLCKG